MFAFLALVITWRVQRDGQLSATHQHMCYPLSKLDVRGKIECPGSQEFDETKNETRCCGKLNDIIEAVVDKVNSDFVIVIIKNEK